MHSPIKTQRLIIPAFLAVILLFSGFKSAEPKDKEGIHWLTFEQMLQQMPKSQKKVVVDVYTDWCGWCKKMDAATFSNAKVADYVNKKFYAVKLDAESMKTLQVNGKTITERELAGQIFKVSGYPTTVYLDESLSVLTTISSYLDVPTFEKVIKFYGEDAYKKQAWPEFESAYKPTF